MDTYSEKYKEKSMITDRKWRVTVFSNSGDIVKSLIVNEADGNNTYQMRKEGTFILPGGRRFYTYRLALMIEELE